MSESTPITSPARAIFCDCTSPSGAFDPATFVESILLFDEIILSNPSKIAEIVDAIGNEGFIALLESGTVCVLGGGFIAQGKYDYQSPGFFANRKSIRRPLNFGFETIFVDTNDPANKSTEERLKIEVDKAKDIGKYDDHDIDPIFDAVCATNRGIDPYSLKQLEGFREDVENKQDYVVGLLLDGLVKHARIPIHVLNWSMDVRQEEEGIFRVETNIGALVGLSDVQLHNLLKITFFEISGTYLQLERMRQVNAASGLSDVQANIVRKRLDFLSRLYATSDQRGAFAKIIEFADVPRLEIGAHFDAFELLELRNSDEARAFRDWIQGATDLSEAEIEGLLRDWKGKVGESLKTKRAGVIKWLASTGLGALTFPGAGGAVTLADRYLKKHFPGRGPIGFIGSGYAEYIKKQQGSDDPSG